MPKKLCRYIEVNYPDGAFFNTEALSTFTTLGTLFCVPAIIN